MHDLDPQALAVHFNHFNLQEAIVARQVIAVFDRTAQVVDVIGTPTRNGKMKYEVVLSTGDSPVTFDENLARQAAALKGQVATAQIEQVQNGQYTNFDLRSISAGGSIGSGVPQGGQQALVAGAAPPPAVTPVITHAKPRDFDRESLGKTRHGQFIAAQQFVLGLAQAGLVPEDTSRLSILNEVVAWADAGVYYVETGKSIALPPESPAVVESPIVVEVPTTPEEVVEQVEQEAPGVVQVGSKLPWGVK